MRVAVMQPYFYPYMGYFRLIAAVDLFILFDCVQFPRRGRVHRTEVPDHAGGRRWLTLPLAHQPRETRIDGLAFADGAGATFAERLAGVPCLAGEGPPAVAEALRSPLDRPIDYVERNMRAVAGTLGITTPMVRSSGFAVPEDVRQADRIAAIARQVGATHYLNAPGGRGLYSTGFFAGHGLTLEFLAPYDGPNVMMLQSLWREPPDRLAADAAAVTVEPA
ncbi:WbqC family protein [Acuticoccus sediminis]|uniref:WbqC family protein n=1 Tax=Acuticoccus sediminis TaxID=2184697 RepID=UPI001CFD5C88|nr:WbqC family protein [Acuticoccus sediminis]